MKLGTYVRLRRKELGLDAKNVAKQLVRSNGRSISAQYWCDIELNRRSAQPWMIQKIARVLKIPAEYLWYLIGLWPPSLRARLAEEDFAMKFSAFRRAQPKTAVLWNLGKK